MLEQSAGTSGDWCAPTDSALNTLLRDCERPMNLVRVSRSTLLRIGASRRRSAQLTCGTLTIDCCERVWRRRAQCERSATNGAWQSRHDLNVQEVFAPLEGARRSTHRSAVVEAVGSGATCQLFPNERSSPSCSHAMTPRSRDHASAWSSFGRSSFMVASTG